MTGTHAGAAVTGAVMCVEGLSKAWDERTIFADVTFAVAAGEIAVIMGPSGCGKTTLLRCLDGLEPADAGAVRVNGVELRAGEPLARAHALELRRQVGFVFQDFHLFSHRTVVENVMEGPVQVFGEDPAVARARAEGLLGELEIAARGGAYPRELSGGEKQRAAIARALAMRPRVLLLDEPTSALDMGRTDSIAALVRGLAAKGLAVVAVTHDERFAAALGARVLRLDGGRLSG